MTGPSPADPSPAASADESIEDAVRQERQAVGDGPEGGGLVPPDDAQSVQPPG